MNKYLFPVLLLAEAVAFLQVIIFCQDLGFREIILEGDSLQVIQELSNFEENGTSTGMMLVDARSLLESFDSWTVQHTGRNNNRVAHAILAKMHWV